MDSSLWQSCSYIYYAWQSGLVSLAAYGQSWRTASDVSLWTWQWCLGSVDTLCCLQTPHRGHLLCVVVRIIVSVYITWQNRVFLRLPFINQATHRLPVSHMEDKLHHWMECLKQVCLCMVLVMTLHCLWFDSCMQGDSFKQAWRITADYAAWVMYGSGKNQTSSSEGKGVLRSGLGS